MPPPDPASPRPRGKWRFRLVALATAAVLCVGLCELGLRLVYGKRLAPFYEEDETSIYRLIPGTEKVVQRLDGHPGGPIPIRINADGHRGPDLRADGEARRVFVYGDSCTLALFSDIEDTYPARLEQELQHRLPGRPFQVVNAGVAGYGPDQELSRMELELGRYRPELAIVVLFADNDLGDLLRNRMYRLDDRGQLVRLRPTLDEALEQQFESARGWILSKALKKALRVLDRPTATANANHGSAIDTALRLRRAEYDEYASGETVVHNLFNDGYDADVSCDPEGESARAKIALLSAIVGRMLETCRRASVPLAIMVIPSNTDICRDVPGYKGMRVDVTEHPKYDPRALTQAMAGAAASHGVPCLDLWDAFTADGNPATLYYPGDDHWDDSGQALAARKMADFLLERGILR